MKVALVLVAVWGAEPESASAPERENVLEEIVVTATRREEPLLDVPVSVSVISGARLDDMGVSGLQQASAALPGVTVASTVLADYVFIRGIGSGNEPSLEQSVATFIDGVYFGKGRTSRDPFFDLERLEVLKGPQGVMFGKNTVAGAFNLTTRKPTAEHERSVELGWDPMHDGYQARTIVSGPLSDSLRGRLAATFGHFGGYVKNTLSGADEPESEDWYIRGTLIYQPSEQFELDLKLEVSDYDIVGKTYQIVRSSDLYEGLSGSVDPEAEFNLDHRRSGTPGFYDAALDSGTLNLRWTTARHVFRSTTNRYRHKRDSVEDADFGGFDLLSTAWVSSELESVSQDLRIESIPDGPLDYVFGLYYADEDSFGGHFEADFNLDAIPPLGAQISGLGLPTALQLIVRSPTQRTTRSAYTEGRVQVSPSWRLRAGARYTEERVSATLSQRCPGDDSFNQELFDIGCGLIGLPPRPAETNRLSADEVSLSVSVEHDWSADTMLFARFAQGFIPGGFSPTSSYRSETADALELGLKTLQQEGRMSLQATVFDTELEDLQVAVFSDILFQIVNPPTSFSRGIEIDGRWRVSPGHTLGAAVAYLDAEYDSFEQAPCPPELPPDSQCDLSGATLPFAPNWSGNLYWESQQFMRGGWRFRSLVEVEATADYLTAADADPRSRQFGFVKLHAGLFFESPEGRYEFAIVGRNLTDRTTSHFIDDVPFTSVIGSNFAAIVDPPRTVSLRLSRKF